MTLHAVLHRSIWLLPLAVAALMAGCATPPPPVQPAPVVPVAQPEPVAPPVVVSDAQNPQSYRYDAASHLYVKNRDRIFQGLMPQFLYAIGVLQVQVNTRGELVGMSWMRAPEHAPEVIAEIERTVRRAAPFPAPVNLGTTTYIETWLWDASGQFQLRTLTEGQSPTKVAARAPRQAGEIRLVSAQSVSD